MAAACLPTVRCHVRRDAPNLTRLHRQFSCSASSGLAPRRNHNRSTHGNGNGNSHNKDKLAQREFFFDVLNASATRRDAKQYLARFREPKKAAVSVRDVRREDEKQQWQLKSSGVNLGGLYLPTRAAAATPTFTQDVDQSSPVPHGQGELHVALVCLRAPHLIDDDTLDGIAVTLAQLVRLDMQIALVIDCEDEVSHSPDKPYQETYRRQAERITSALDRHNNAGARYVDSAMFVQDSEDPVPAPRPQVLGNVSVAVPELITVPLKRGAIPVIPPIAHSASWKARKISVAPVVLALTRTLSGLSDLSDTTDPERVLPRIDSSVDRIIMLDPLGGLPTETRQDKAHVFINLEQEYDYIRDELHARHLSKHHLDTLDLVRDCLTILPPSSSALLISPAEAAISSRSGRNDPSIGIATRRQKNPLIHNLLTNKPLISSSLPVARLSSNGILPTVSSEDATRSTLVKRGMPLIIVPDPRKQPWAPPRPGEETIALDHHPDIDFARLVALIEDSFRRPLDAKHYLDRIKNRVAGVIIAGEYEGGAILTWEKPPTVSGSDPSLDPSRLVPYLDKFAVLQRSQGSSGVADIVFQAMVRSCFPNGVCWRSRWNNPVNKWYFERSHGTWHLKGTQWTMFWTSQNLEQDHQQWEDYVSVCKNIEPSWADNKAKPD